MQQQSTRRYTVLAIIAIIFVLVLATSAVYLIRSEKDVRVSEARYESITVQSFGILGAMKTALPQYEGSLADYAEGGSIKAAIITNNDVDEVYLLSGSQKQLTSDGTKKAALAVSSDGSTLAYAALTNPREDGFILSTARWTVRVVDIASGTSRDLGAGFAPEFFVRDGVGYVLYTTPTSLAVFNLLEKNGFETLFFTPSAIDYTARVSENGEFFAIRGSGTAQHSIYRIDSLDRRLSYSLIRPIDVIFTDVEWQGNELLGLSEPTAEGLVKILKTTTAVDSALAEVATFTGQGNYRFIH